MADAHLFHAALTFPHYLASITLLMILFWCAVRLLNEALTRNKMLLLLALGIVANIGVALVYPFFVILSCGVLAAYLVLIAWRSRDLTQYIPILDADKRGQTRIKIKPFRNPRSSAKIRVQSINLSCTASGLVRRMPRAQQFRFAHRFQSDFVLPLCRVP
jgi:hypothetical protein